MSENSCIPHIRIPRSLLKDPLWIDLSLAYQNIFMVLIEKVCFKPQKFDDHGVLIDLKPGQICISERELLKFCHKSLSKNEIHRSIEKFILYGFLNQEVIHRKNVLTITHKDTYELILKYSEPRIEPNLNQTRTKLEPEKEKEDKENNVVVVEKKNLDDCSQLQKPKEISKDDVISFSIEFKKDWTAQEIEEAWEITSKKQNVNDPISYLEGIIIKKRENQQNKSGRKYAAGNKRNFDQGKVIKREGIYLDGVRIG